MEAKTYLSWFQKRISPYFDQFFKEKVAKAKSINPLAVETTRTLRNYMTGGKQARGALTVLGYQSAGGKGLAKILPAALAVELIHNALVIHDDFIDHDEMRRGKPTVHTLYSQKRNPHYGASIALFIGDLAFFYAYQIISGLKFEPKLVLQASQRLNQLLINTGFGELLDIDSDYWSQVHAQDILKIRTLKTADYTFVMPLTFGAILGGARPKQIQALENYGRNVGLAFQLRDDELGVFGDPKVTGKSAESDIREGKWTLLYLKALELANREDKAFLKKHYGSSKITPSQIKKIKNIIQSSGALEYSQQKSQEYVKRGLKYTSHLTLISLGNYMISREK